MANDVKVKMHIAGVKDVLKSSGVVSDLERRGNAIAREATSNAKEHYPNIGYRNGAEIFVSKTTKTRKRGLPEVIVFANPGIHSGSKENPGAPLGDYAQANHSALTQAISAGR